MVALAFDCVRLCGRPGTIVLVVPRERQSDLRQHHSALHIRNDPTGHITVDTTVVTEGSGTPWAICTGWTTHASGSLTSALFAALPRLVVGSPRLRAALEGWPRWDPEGAALERCLGGHYPPEVASAITGAFLGFVELGLNPPELTNPPPTPQRRRTGKFRW